jgi:regulator of cell morphogenesis and NO signaling
LNTHHKYVVSALPIIFEYTQKVKNVHGQNHPEAIKIANDFVTVIDELNAHMMKEEKILFPIIKELVEAKRNKTTVEPFHCGSVQGPISVMEMEHETVGEILGNLNEMTNGFTPPEDACTTFRLSYAKLKEFEDDLHQHIHLENNILFPKALELEREMGL